MSIFLLHRAAAAAGILGLVLFTPGQGFASTSDSGTLLVGESVFFCGPSLGSALIFGFSSITGTGSYSPTGLTGGDTVAIVEDVLPASCIRNFSALSVSGFSSNPGGSWLVSITCNGKEAVGTSASYSYTSGVASWQWGGAKFGLSSENGDNVGCTVTHN